MTSVQTPSVLVVGGGLPLDSERLRQLAQAYDSSIAADAGALTLRNAELTPAFVTGDFDSLSEADLAWLPPDRRRHKPDQSSTDLEKAVLLALEQGAKRIGLACATGDRIDHTLNAVSLMLRYRNRAEFTLHDAHGDATLAFAPGTALNGKPGDRLSLVPAPGATGVRSSGLKYLLDGIDLVFGGRDGISNELMVAQARLTFKTGSLLVYRFLS